MHFENLLGLLTVLSLGSGAQAHPNPYQQGSEKYALERRHLFPRQGPLSNITTAASTEPLITSAPVATLTTASDGATTATSSAAPTSTISGGEIAIAVIGATYVVGAGGAILSLGGVTHALGAGSVVTAVLGGPKGDIPEIETISDPSNEQPQTSDAPEVTPTSTAASTTTEESSTSSTATSSAAPAPTPYIVLFGPDATEDQISSVNETLSKEAAADSLTQVVSDRSGLVVFFKANITSTQADAIGEESGVSGVFVDETVAEDELESAPSLTTALPSSTSSFPIATGTLTPSVPNTDDIRLQTGAVEELRVISQPPHTSLDDLPDFGYAAEGGEGVTIYVLDTGANPKNPEWYNMPGDKSFMYSPGAPLYASDFMGHGSCVASKATGPTYGTAKNASIVAVKLPKSLSFSSILAALIDISNDVFEKGLGGKAVINMSIGTKMPKHVADPYRVLLMALLAEDIVIVTASGNDRTDVVEDVTEYPALFGKDTNIIVVGGIKNNGERASYSQGTGDQLTVSAPGTVYCADGRGAGVSKISGTSFAAPAVAGVIAVWLSQDEHKDRLQVEGKVAANVKKMVQELSYARIDGQPPAIWNGIDPRGLSCSINGKRQADTSGGSCQATSSSAVPTSTAMPTSTAPTATASSTSLPDPPAKPVWSESPDGFTKAFEGDEVGSALYDATSDSASEGVTDDIESWCLAKCTDSCQSVFLYRVVQDLETEYNIYFICNQYNKAWSDDLVSTDISYADAGIAFNKT